MVLQTRTRSGFEVEHLVSLLRLAIGQMMSTRGLTTGGYLVDVSLEDQTALDDLRQNVMDLGQCERMSGCAGVANQAGVSEAGVVGRNNRGPAR
jgi:hypothetical protein